MTKTTLPRLTRFVRLMPLIAALAVASCGGLVLIGWIADVEVLKSLLHPDRVAMNPVTALCFILCAVALVLLRHEDRPDEAWLAQWCASIVIVVGAIRVLGYWFDWSLGPDQLLFADKLAGNVMAPNTAVSFVLAGIAMLLLDWRLADGLHPAQSFTISSAAIALLALTGYLYRITPLYGVSGHIPMALNTALCFTLLAGGMLCARPTRQPLAMLLDDTVGGIVARRLLPAAFLVPLLLGWLRLIGEKKEIISREFGFTMLVLSIIVVFNALVWWNAQIQRRIDLRRRGAEDELRESEARHRAVMEQAADGITLVDAQTLRIIEVNEAFARLMGYTRREMAGRLISDLIVDTPGGVAARAQQTLNAASGSLVTRRQYRRKDGSIAEVEKSASVLQLGGRRVLCTVVHDITERKRAEEKLANERNLLRTLIDNLPDRINVKDNDGRYVLDNTAHVRQLGLLGTEQVIGKTVRDFYPLDVATRLEEVDRAVMQTAKPLLDQEEAIVDHDGSRRWVLTTRVPILDAHGQVQGMVGMTRDITERKLAQHALEEKHRLLQEAMRSEQEAMAQLKQAQSAMVQSEKLAGLGQMVAGVAHEINNPLAFVSNNVAVLQRDVRSLAALLKLYGQGDPLLAEHNAELLAQIHELSQRMDLSYTLTNLDELLVRSRDGLRRIQQIVRDLREFARLDASDLHEADLNAGIESTINIVRGVAKKRQVALEVELQPLPPVSCYPAKINQVVMNLVTNAIDACPIDGKVIVRSSRVGDSVRIEVADNGGGIPPDLRQRIFDPFFTTKPIGQGTGLGLSISYGIVQDHGGAIAVESELGRGTTFTVTLPFKARVMEQERGVRGVSAPP
jgi:two-component system NtrC family sensor kinase